MANTHSVPVGRVGAKAADHAVRLARPRVELAEVPRAAELQPARLDDALQCALEQHAGTGSWLIDLARDELLCTPQARRLLGLPRELANTRAASIQTFCTDASRRHLVAVLREAVAGGRPFRATCELRGTRGAARWVELSGQLARRTGRSPCLVGTIRDVTAEHAQAQRLHLLETAVSSIHDLVVMLEAGVDSGGEPLIASVNDAFVRTTGYERREVVGRTMALLRGAGTDAAEARRFDAALRAGKPLRSELLHYAKDGAELWLELGVAASDAEDRRRHLVAVGRDVTARRCAAACGGDAHATDPNRVGDERGREQAPSPQFEAGERARLRDEHDRLVQLEREQGRLGRELQDGIGQKLGAIAFVAKALECKLVDRSAAQDARWIVQLLGDALDHVRFLSRDLSRIEIDGGALAPAIARLVSDVRTIYGIDAFATIGPGLDGIDETCATPCFRIVQEAVDNALRHGRASEIRIALRARRGALVLAIGDNGVGFSSHERGSAEGPGPRGMRVRALLLGGRLRVRSGAYGTMFLVRIPLQRDGDGPAAGR